MSYILEALKKAQAERAHGAVPGVDAQPVPTVAARAPLPMPAWMIVLLVLLGTGVVLYWQGRERPQRSMRRRRTRRRCRRRLHRPTPRRNLRRLHPRRLRLPRSRRQQSPCASWASGCRASWPHPHYLRRQHQHRRRNGSPCCRNCRRRYSVRFQPLQSTAISMRATRLTGRF